MRGYQELNDVISVAGLEAAETEWSGWLEGYWWVGKVVLRAEADQPFDLFVRRRGSDGSLGMELTVESYGEIVPAGQRHETDYPLTTGMSFCVGVKNNGPTAGDFKVSLVLVE